MENLENVPQQVSARTFDPSRISYAIFALTAFLLPFFFVPLGVVTVESSKVMLLSAGIITAFFLLLVDMVRRGEFEVPRHRIFLVMLAIPTVFLLSALFSTVPNLSLFGYNLETGSWAFVTMGFLIVLLASLLLRSKERLFYSYVGFLAGLVVVLLIALAKLIFGGSTLSFGVLEGIVSNPVGAWVDLAAFLGLGAAVTVMSLEMAEMRKILRVVLWIVFLGALSVLAALNFAIVWMLLLAFALVFFIYIVSVPDAVSSERRRRISYPAIVLFLVSLLFFINPSVSDQGGVGETVADAFGVSTIEVRPSFTATRNVVQSTLETSPVLGSGPNTFGREWLLHKPEGVNLSQFWNLSFPNGFGLLPTFVATTGILGSLAWLSFLLLYVYVGTKALFLAASSKMARFFIASSFFASLFLWAVAFVYVPGVTVFALAFYFTGLFVASLISEGALGTKKISFGHNASLSFVSVLALIVVLVGGAAFALNALERPISRTYFERARAEAVEGGDISKVISDLRKAITISEQDIYYRSLAQAYIAEVNRVINDSSISDEEKAEKFQDALRQSVTSAQDAIDRDPQNYENWLTLGQIYEALVPEPFSIPGSFDSAKSAYEEALKRNPQSPEIYLLMARLEIAGGNTDMAREHLRASIRSKANYADAYYLLAQLEVGSNNISEAIQSAEVVALLSPTNAGVFFQLGLLKYNVRDYPGAAEAFARALDVAPDYANAQYFLGLTFHKLDRSDLAIEEFRNLEKTNPDNQEVKLILANLVRGEDPFAGAPESISSDPEDRPEPPFE